MKEGNETIKLYENRYLYIYNLLERLKPIIVLFIGYEKFNGLVALMIVKHYFNKD